MTERKKKEIKDFSPYCVKVDSLKFDEEALKKLKEKYSISPETDMACTLNDSILCYVASYEEITRQTARPSEVSRRIELILDLATKLIDALEKSPLKIQSELTKQMTQQVLSYKNIKITPEEYAISEEEIKVDLNYEDIKKRYEIREKVKNKMMARFLGTKILIWMLFKLQQACNLLLPNIPPDKGGRSCDLMNNLLMNFAWVYHNLTGQELVCYWKESDHEGEASYYGFFLDFVMDCINLIKKTAYDQGVSLPDFFYNDINYYGELIVKKIRVSFKEQLKLKMETK